MRGRALHEASQDQEMREYDAEGRVRKIAGHT